ncbi:Helitron helicase [Phytophthora megakarya]|uniref:Helitron helicase n=1 Tax=Phytophthora megakarya TaxID=4795 RepID=A0A225WAF2_9STRA|nr:Helitron helicase [Phytophthora megakarya]
MLSTLRYKLQLRDEYLLNTHQRCDELERDNAQLEESKTDLTSRVEALQAKCESMGQDLTPPNDPLRSSRNLSRRQPHCDRFEPTITRLGLTSMGATVCDNVAIDTVYANGQKGVYTFRVQGTICHRIGTLLPEDGAEPSFAQVYVYGGDMKHQVDRRMKTIDGLDRTTLKAPLMILVANNPYVGKFLTAREIAREGVNLCLMPHEDPGTNLRTHSRSTANEVAANIVDEFASKERDIVVNLRGGGLQRISDLHSAYDPLQFPLLFPFGEQGWSTTVEYVPDVQRYKNKRMKVRDFYAYQLSTRKDQYYILHLSSRLFQQWCVEMYAKIELQRLRFIKQVTPSDTTGRFLSSSSRWNLGEVGRSVLLPPSFTGGEKYMRKQYYDSTRGGEAGPIHQNHMQS